MANVTLSIDDDLLRRCRAYAEARGVSLNALICELLERAVPVASGETADREMCKLMDDLRVSLKGKRRSRNGLYHV